MSVSEEMDDEGLVEIDLTDQSGDSNVGQEFFLVIVNNGDSELGYSIEYSVPSQESESEEGETQESRIRTNAKPLHKQEKSEYARRLEEAKEEGRISRVLPPNLPPPPYTSSDIGPNTRENFKVRDSLDDEESYERIEAILWAVGDNVNIWVDDTVAIDWDFECDGIIDQPSLYPSYGFDNCDLQTIADIVDVNIFPNLRSIFGDESDENGDSKVAVVITPVLNQMTRGLDEEDSDLTLVGSYADPSVDLTTFDPEDNPISDEQEVIYVHAPDPFGFHNPTALTPISEYTNVNLGTQIARAFFRLISYNQKVLINEADAEETWVDEGMAALAADLVGFGSPNFEGVWDYLDASHLYSLTDVEESGAISTSSFGAQYLFFRWLVDAKGVTELQAIVQSSSTGSENIEDAIGESIESLVLKWQMALMSKHSTISDVGLEIDPLDFAPYNYVETMQAPITNPSSGDYYGANGYQSGIDVGGINSYMEGGTTNSPSENTAKRVSTSHTDHSTFVFGQDFFGYIAAGYGAQVVRLVDVPFVQTELEVRTPCSSEDDGTEEGEDEESSEDSESDCGADFAVAVIRVLEGTSKNYSKDTLYSPTDVNNILLPELPIDKTAIYGLGDISATGLSVVIDDEGSEDTAEVYDTDRWLLSLLNFPTGSPVNVALWLDHRYSDTSGQIGLEDPWVGIVPREYLPVPTVNGTQSGACADAYQFGYPYKLLSHLYSQLFLSSTAYNDSDLLPVSSSSSSEEDDDESSGQDGFDPCGSIESDTTTCDIDWDRDGVLDVNEPYPESFVSQVRVMQCNLAGNDISAFDAVGTEIIDVDEVDEDDDSTYDRKSNVGSVSAEDGEGAYLEVELEGGREYVIVVGASEGNGPYEFTVQMLTE